MLVYPIDQHKTPGTISTREFLALEIHGTIGKSSGCGLYVCGAARTGDYLPISGIYCTSRQYGKKFFYRKRTYRPTNPQTTEQQNWRIVLKNAMIAWQALDPEDQSEMNRIAAKQGMSGSNLFISRVLKKYRAENP